MLLLICVILFSAVTAIGGILLGSFAIRGREVPVYFSLIHGVLGVSGLSVLAIILLQAQRMSLGWLSLALFVLTVMIGFGLLSYSIRKKNHPRNLVFGHGTAALAGYLVLLWWCVS